MDMKNNNSNLYVNNSNGLGNNNFQSTNDVQTSKNSYGWYNNSNSNSNLNSLAYGNSNSISYGNFTYNPNYNTESYNKYLSHYNNQFPNQCMEEFVFEVDELYLYREVKGMGEFYSYKNKAVKGCFKDRTVVKMNPDMFYIDILNPKGDKLLFRLDEINTDHPYYGYIRILVDFHDFCFNKENLMRFKEHNQMVEDYVTRTIKKIERSDQAVFGRTKNFSDNYLYNKQPTNEDIQNLLKRNEQMLKDIESLKNVNKGV